MVSLTLDAGCLVTGGFKENYRRISQIVDLNDRLGCPSGGAGKDGLSGGFSLNYVRSAFWLWSHIVCASLCARKALASLLP